VLVVLVVLLTWVIAGSTVQADWVPGLTVLVQVSLLGVAVMGALALIRRLPWPVGLTLGIVAGPIVAYVATAQMLHRAHPGDPTYSPDLVVVWISRLSSGAGNSTEEAFYLFLLALLFWFVGGWLAWCVLRWRQPLVGLIPGAAAFATNILNYPADQNGYTLGFIALTLLLLLWTSYQRSLEGAARQRLRLSSDARWDFWETGVVVMAAVIALGIFLPPLSHVDTTVDLEGGAFRNWAELNQQLNHPVAFGHGTSTGTSTGFADAVPLGGSIHRTGGVVFTYQIEGSFNGPRYFRGLNLERTELQKGQASWRYAGDATYRQSLNRDSELPYAEVYDSQGAGAFKIQMLKPPGTATDLLFYPGTLVKTDRDTVALSGLGHGPAPTDKIYTLDRLSSPGRVGGLGPYKVSVTASSASEEQLRQAGTAYPTWLDPYRNFSNTYRSQQNPDPTKSLTPMFTYRPSPTLSRVRDLALKVTEGRTNPYDQAAAIENYLRSSFNYATNVADPPRDVDPEEFFLFTTKSGYCEYFATAMGDMLRSLGIPTRLVNGFGPGQFDEKLQRYVVRESDAHTWVEAYFPHYGWIPFEPTADGNYFPIPRGSSGSASCQRDSEICNLNGDEAAPAQAPTTDKGELDAGFGGGGSGSGLPLGIPPAVPIGLAVVLLGVLVLYVMASRYLRPRTVGGVWSRTTLLCRLAGLRGSPGETPLEFGRRISDEFPETAQPIRSLAEDFVVAAYAPAEQARGTRARILETWAELRPLLVGRVRSRFRLAT
jgi:hypothetical protein